MRSGKQTVLSRSRGPCPRLQFLNSSIPRGMKFSKELPSLLAVLSISIGWKLVLHCSLKLTVYQILFEKTVQRLRFKFSISSVWQLKQFQIDVWSKWILPLQTKLVWWDLTQLEEYAIDLGKVLSHSSPRRWTALQIFTVFNCVHFPL